MKCQKISATWKREKNKEQPQAEKEKKSKEWWKEKDWREKKERKKNKEKEIVARLTKERHGVTQKGLIGKHIYSRNRNKIKVNLVKDKLVDRKRRVQCGSDYPSPTQMVSHVIVSRWLVNSVWRSRWRGWVHYVGSATEIEREKKDRKRIEKIQEDAFNWKWE